MADTFTIGRTTQMSPEVTHGVAPAAGAVHQLTDLIIPLDPSFGVQEVRGIGRRFVSVVVPNGMEYTIGKIGGGLGFNSWVYLLSMVWGAATITRPFANSINAYQWQWTVPLTGSINPVSMDIEQGDSTDAEQALWSIMTDVGFDATRQAVTPAGSLMARAINKAQAAGPFTAMTTAGVTSVPLAPVLPDDWSVYVELTSGALLAGVGAATTKVLRAFHAKFDYGGAFVPFFPLDSALTSYGGTADGDAVKATLMLELMKDPAVGEALWTVARNGVQRYVRVVAGSATAAPFVTPLIDNAFTLNGSASYTAGTVGLTYKGVAGSFAFNALGSAIQTALTGISTIGANNCTVTPAGTAFNTATTFIVTMTGTLSQDATLPTVTTQPTGGTVAVTSIQCAYAMQYDMAAKINLPGPNKDFQGLRTREWTFTINEDPVWGKALIVTVVNSLASLGT